MARLLVGRVPEDTRVRPLYGDLPHAAQDAAVLPEPDGAERRACLLGPAIHYEPAFKFIK